MRDLQMPERLARVRYQYEFFDDFDWYISPHFWTNLASDGGVTGFAQSDAEHGVIQGATGATNNNEIMVRGTNEIALFQADYSFIAEVRLQYTEANTDDANIAFGLADTAAANLLADNGGGDNINSSGVLIFKIDGGTVWRCASEINGTINEEVSVQTAGGASYQVLRIIGHAVDGTNMEFTYFMDGSPLTDSTNRPISHRLAYASATEMRLVACYAKAGSTNSETVNVDYCYFAHTRV